MEVVRKPVLTVGGKQEQFLGMRVGEFLLVPDSDSGTRPDALRVTGPKGMTLVVHGGMSLRVETHAEGFSLQDCLEKITKDDRAVLRGIAWNLPGRGWPAVGELLQKRWELWGEEKILAALQNLFKAARKH